MMLLDSLSHALISLYPKNTLKTKNDELKEKGKNKAGLFVQLTSLPADFRHL